MRRTGTLILWLLWFAVATVPWSETRLDLFTNLVAAGRALVAGAWFWALATALGWKALAMVNGQVQGNVVRGEASPRGKAIHLLFSANRWELK